MHFFFELHICHSKDERFIYYINNTTFAVQYCIAKAREMERNKTNKTLKKWGRKKCWAIFDPCIPSQKNNIPTKKPAYKNKNTIPATFLPISFLLTKKIRGA